MADNKNFIQEAKEADTSPAVINPPTGPFTTEIIRSGIIAISTGAKNPSELATEFNNKAYEHYKKQ